MSTKKLTPISPPQGVAAGTMNLPDGLFWTNEFAWSPVAQTAIRGLDGTLHPHAMTRKGGGRPIELSAGDDVWITRGELRKLMAWAAIPLQKFTLWINGHSYTVVFDNGADEEGKSIQVSPVLDFSDIRDGDYYCGITLRFLTVA